MGKGKVSKQPLCTSMVNMITRNYRPIWKTKDRKAAFDLCNRIRTYTDVPAYTQKKFDEGFQYRHIFQRSYKTAKDEFFQLVFGWW